MPRPALRCTGPVVWSWAAAASVLQAFGRAVAAAWACRAGAA